MAQLVEQLRIAIVADDANASAVLAAVQQRGERTATALTVQATRTGLATTREWGKVRQATQAMGLAMAEIPGPAGRMAASLLALGAGGAISAAVLAGVGLLTLAYRKLTEETRKAAEQQKKFREEGQAAWRQMLGPQQALEDRLASLKQQQADARVALAAAQAGRLEESRFTGREQIVDQAAIDRATEALRARNREVAGTERELADLRRKAGEDAVAARGRELEALQTLGQQQALQLADVARLFQLQQQITAELAKQAGLTAEQRATLGAQAGVAGRAVTGFFPRAAVVPIQGAGPAPLRFGEPQFVQQAVTGDPRARLRAAAAAQDEYAAAVQEAVIAYEDATRRTQQATELFAVGMIGAISGAIAALVSGSGAGFIGAIGGIVSLLPGGAIPGALIGGLGSIIGAAGGGHEIPVRLNSVSDAAASRLAQAQGPERVTIVITDQRGTILETREVLRRAEQRDAVPRLVGGMV